MPHKPPRYKLRPPEYLLRIESQQAPGSTLKKHRQIAGGKQVVPLTMSLVKMVNNKTKVSLVLPLRQSIVIIREVLNGWLKWPFSGSQCTKRQPSGPTVQIPPLLCAKLKLRVPVDWFNVCSTPTVDSG